MKAIYKRDFLSFFKNISGYIFFTLFFLVCGYLFTLENILNSSGSLKAMYRAAGVFLTVTVPFLTSHTLIDGREVNAEQRHYVSSLKIVLSKFAAVMTLPFMALSTTWIYFGILSIFARPYISEAFTSLLGLCLLCACLISLTMFIVSFAHRKMQAYSLIFTLILVFFVANNLITLARSTFYEHMFHVFGLFSSYLGFLNGMFSVTSLIYMLSFTAVCLILCCIILERKKEAGV